MGTTSNAPPAPATVAAAIRRGVDHPDFREVPEVYLITCLGVAQGCAIGAYLVGAVGGMENGAAWEEGEGPLAAATALLTRPIVESLSLAHTLGMPARHIADVLAAASTWPVALAALQAGQWDYLGADDE